MNLNNLLIYNPISLKSASISLKKGRSIGRAMLIVFLILSAFLFTSCHTSKKIKSRPGHPQVEALNIRKGNKTQRKIAEEAQKWLGTPYKYAGAEKGIGTDCSGFVLRVYEKVTDIKMPRNSAKQAEFCQRINADEVELGDLVFFATGKDASKISHVGIILDDDNFIHASSSKGVVISKLSTNYYQTHFKMFGRVPGMKN